MWILTQDLGKDKGLQTLATLQNNVCFLSNFGFAVAVCFFNLPKNEKFLELKNKATESFKYFQ